MFYLKLKNAPGLFDGMTDRGFFGDGNTKENFFCFDKKIDGDIVFRVFFSAKKPNLFDASLITLSHEVTRIFHEASLFLNGPVTPMDEATGVLSTNLLWLRLNQHNLGQESIQDDYAIGPSTSVLKFFHDLDSVGESYFMELSSRQKIATFLSDIKSYPCNITYGGKPGSVSPYIYSAILFFLSGDQINAQLALKKGLLEYSLPTPTPMLLWQKVRFNEFVERAKRLVDLFVGPCGISGVDAAL